LRASRQQTLAVFHLIKGREKETSIADIFGKETAGIKQLESDTLPEQPTEEIREKSTT